MRTIGLSGWGQPHDALSVIAPEATHIEYAHHDNVEDALAEIATQAKNSDTVIGWSLGGQLAMRAIAARMFKPKRLVLIATPLQFAATPERPLGMKRDLYDKFRENYAKNPERTLHKAWELIHKDDTNAERIRRHMEMQDKSKVLEKEWLRWFFMLDDFAFDESPLADFPPTLLLHGDKDLVVDVAQSQHLAKAIPKSKRIVYKGCGHAPHWHDAKGVTEAIEAFIHV